jgi:hypothetical protein
MRRCSCLLFNRDKRRLSLADRSAHRMLLKQKLVCLDFGE